MKFKVSSETRFETEQKSREREREREREGKYQNREVALFFNFSVCSFLYPLLCTLSLSLSLSKHFFAGKGSWSWTEARGLANCYVLITKQSMSELPFFIMTSDPRNSYSSDINALRTGFSIHYITKYYCFWINFTGTCSCYWILLVSSNQG